jgi:hypothetical protein
MNMKTCRHGDMEIWRHGDMETWRYGDMNMETSNRIWKPMRFSIVRLPFAHRASVSLSFVRLLTKKQTEVILLQRTKQTCPSLPSNSPTNGPGLGQETSQGGGGGIQTKYTE